LTARSLRKEKEATTTSVFQYRGLVLKKRELNGRSGIFVV